MKAAGFALQQPKAREHSRRKRGVRSSKTVVHVLGSPVPLFFWFL